MEYITDKHKMLNSPHYAILEFSSIHIPGDERSKTHPGHGYPASTEDIVKYIAFHDEEEWKKEIQKRSEQTYYGDKFVAIHVDKVAQIVKRIDII